MEHDAKEYTRQVLARLEVTASEEEIERLTTLFGQRPPRRYPALATEPQLVQVPERWR